MGGKGSAPRPFSVTNEEYAKRWDAIFGRDLKKEDDLKNEDDEFKYLETISELNSETDKLTRYNEETQEVKK